MAQWAGRGVVIVYFGGWEGCYFILFFWFVVIYCLVGGAGVSVIVWWEVPIDELRVDVLNGSSGFLSGNKARYHRPTGFTALLETTKHMLLESPSVL